MCPYCPQPTRVIRIGHYSRPSDGARIQRRRCGGCRRSFSDQIRSIDYRLRKRQINQQAFMTLCSGVSQRRCAFLVGVRRRAIDIRISRFGLCAKNNLDVYRRSREKAFHIQIDEMESSEHTKCKPVTIPIAVEKRTRKILSLRVGSIAAKGHLSKIALAKYGRRKCERARVLKEVLEELKTCVRADALIESDESANYPNAVTRAFPEAKHKTSKGRRGCTTGQGEMKKGGFDPLFTLNHSYAMVRDNLKCLTRQTWCTTKLKEKLEMRLYTYAWFHNLWLDRKFQPIELRWIGEPN